MKKVLTTLLVVVFMMADYAFSQVSWPDHENRISVSKGRISLQFKAYSKTDTLTAGTGIPLTRNDLATRKTWSAEKSRTTSIFGTVIPVFLGVAIKNPAATPSLMAFGVVFGPVSGYIYADELNKGIMPAVTRGAVLGGTIAAIAIICAGGNCELGLFGEEPGSGLGIAVVTGLAGFVATLVLVVRDISRVGRIVEAKNRRLVNVSLKPAWLAESRSVGVALSVRF